MKYNAKKEVTFAVLTIVGGIFIYLYYGNYLGGSLMVALGVWNWKRIK